MENHWHPKALRHSLPPEGAIAGVRLLTYGAGSTEPWHAHEQGQLIFTTAGVVRIQTEQQVWILAPFQALWLPGGIPHQLYAINPVTTSNVYLTADASRQYSTDFRCLQVTPLLQALVEELVVAPLPHGVARHEALTALLYNELSWVPPARVCQIVFPLDRRARTVCDALCQAPANNETLACWGQKVGASERTLARIFREQTRHSFAGWRQNLRLAEAICYLAQGQSIKRLSAELGYQSTSAFIAMFRKQLGTTPQRFLQKNEVSLPA
ncbi:AraC family transcriptional regulator [Paramixta manurensis]|uniref:AraC family transcriptional regulator n=1 Tax=Paramixta manurensis TaxID=2740817 RepID=A0A6M8U6C2_9GAMM|nr:AraC family transcriptional regulator [Erwiniaceae bacterium PD-1]